MKIKAEIRVNKVVTEIKEVNIGNNPFLSDLKIPVNNVVLKDKHKEEDGVLLPVEIYIEKTPFVKLFNTSENRKILNNVSTRAKELLFWIAFKLEAGQEVIQVNRVNYMKELGIKSVNTYKTAAHELVRYGMLAETKVIDVYWINPEFIFHGNRIKKYPKQVENHGTKL